jgi:hypothetical protein
LAIGLVSCTGGNSNKQQSGNSATETKTETKTEQAAASAPTAANLSNFNDAQKKLVASFGKTEKGKKIVAYEKLSFGVEYTVASYSGGDLTVKEYVIYFPANEDGFKTVRHSEKDVVDAATLSVCTTETHSGSKVTPFNEMYQYFKEDNKYTVVE